jgi:hypothetical protein
MKRANSYRKICLQRFVFNSAICFTDSLLLTFNYCYKQNRKLYCIIIASLWMLNSNLGFDKDNKSNNQQRKCQYPVYSIDSIDDKRIQNIIDNKKIQGQIKQRQNILNLPNSAFNISMIDDEDDVLFTFEFIVKNEGYNVVSYSKLKQSIGAFI